MEAVYKKVLTRLYFLRRLRSFTVCSQVLQMFNQSVVASTIFFCGALGCGHQGEGHEATTQT